MRDDGQEDFVSSDSPGDTWGVLAGKGAPLLGSGGDAIGTICVDSMLSEEVIAVVGFLVDRAVNSTVETLPHA